MVIRHLLNAQGKGHFYTVTQYITTMTHVVSQSTKRLNRTDTRLRMRTDETERYERLLCGDTWTAITKETFDKEMAKPVRD